jgi:hypothetical protein
MTLTAWWRLVREVILTVVATILFPVDMFSQGWSGRFLESKPEKYPKN